MSNKAYILLADDEPNVLLTLKLVLEQDGYEVVTADSAATAIALMNQPRRFDAIVTDLNMEKQDIGLDVAREAAKLQPRPAIIIITGFASIENARAALKIQVEHFATKPIDLNDLMLTLDRFSPWPTAYGSTRRTDHMNNAVWKKHALILHPDLSTLSSYQTLLSRNDFVVVVGTRPSHYSSRDHPSSFRLGDSVESNRGDR